MQVFVLISTDIAFHFTIMQMILNLKNKLVWSSSRF